MDNDLKNKINDFLKTPFDDGGSLKGAPATDEQIKSSENKLNYKFSQDYIDFIKEFGGAYLGVNIHAFNNHSMMSKDTVTETTQEFRKAYEGRSTQELIAKSLVIAIDGTGNPILISSDGKVFIVYHDSEDDVELLANRFNEFIIKIIDKEINDLF